MDNSIARNPANWKHGLDLLSIFKKLLIVSNCDEILGVWHYSGSYLNYNFIEWCILQARVCSWIESTRNLVLWLLTVRLRFIGFRIQWMYWNNDFRDCSKFNCLNIHLTKRVVLNYDIVVGRWPIRFVSWRPNWWKLI